MPGLEPIILSPADFVALLNQTLEYAYPNVVIEGEIANFRVSKNRWVYFDLKDDMASVKCFGTVYQLPGPLEDGLRAQVRAVPRLHQQFGFSLNIQAIQPVGEGTLKRAFEMLMAKLKAEGLFEAERKRRLPYPPQRIGLITSGESAAYADFVKILNERWGGLEICLADVQVQGEAAPGQIVAAIEYLNQHDRPCDVLVITRGGGSADDLYAFSTEQVTRAVAASRIPTIVAIGHEVDISLAELAADQRASTPSNAAQLLVPDRNERLAALQAQRADMGRLLERALGAAKQRIANTRTNLNDAVQRSLAEAREDLERRDQLLKAYDPLAVLRRGYSLVRLPDGTVVTRSKDISANQLVRITFADGEADAKIISSKG